MSVWSYILGDPEVSPETRSYSYREQLPFEVFRRKNIISNNYKFLETVLSRVLEEQSRIDRQIMINAQETYPAESRTSVVAHSETKPADAVPLDIAAATELAKSLAEPIGARAGLLPPDANIGVYLNNNEDLSLAA